MKNKSISLYKKLPLREKIEAAEQRLLEGYYLLRPCGVELNETECNRLSIELLDLLKIQLKERKKEISEIASAFINEKINAQSFLLKAFKNEGSEIRKVILELNLSEDLVTFFAIYLARPFRQQAAIHLLDGIKISNWFWGYCPVCGHWPSLGHIKTEDGHRTLWCLHCDTKWKFKRIQCPFCLTEDQNNLELINIQNDEEHRIQVCKKCKRYLKEARSNTDISDFPFDKIYLATLPLDIIAQQEGYIQEPMLTVRYDNSDGNEMLMYRQEKSPAELRIEQSSEYYNK